MSREAPRQPLEAEAIVVLGSDFPGAYRQGVQVSLSIDELSGRIIVTRGHGLVKLARLVGPAVEAIIDDLRAGAEYTGLVIGVSEREGQKILRLTIDRRRSRGSGDLDS